jgi:hypothetical protein
MNDVMKIRKCLFLPGLSIAAMLLSNCSSNDTQPGRMTDTSSVVGSNVSGVSSGESAAIGSVLSHSMGYPGYGYGGYPYYGPRVSGYDAVVRKR